MIHVAVGSTGKAENVARVLFGREFEAEVWESFGRLPPEPLSFYRPQDDYAIQHTRTDVITEPLGESRR